jgi:hypothetical protein
MAMVVAYSHQDFVDGHWRFAILLGNMSEEAWEQQQGIRDRK